MKDFIADFAQIMCEAGLMIAAIIAFAALLIGFFG